MVRVPTTTQIPTLTTGADPLTGAIPVTRIVGQRGRCNLEIRHCRERIKSGESGDLTMTLVLDGEGILRDPGLHDGLLLGIVLSPNGDKLTLLCRDVDGKEFRLTIPELVRLRVDEFMLGNIIFDVSIREGDNCPPESVQRAYSYDDDSARKYLPSRLKEIRDGRWTLVEVGTSYGCELFALSRAHADQITAE
jgi:hypothetical protein